MPDDVIEFLGHKYGLARSMKRDVRKLRCMLCNRSVELAMRTRTPILKLLEAEHVRPCTTCDCDKRCRTRDELLANHGTVEAFASACWRASNDLFITDDEATAAIAKYRALFDRIANAPVADSR